ncbi:MAG TPA: 3-oxoacyl-[acyl-carrier-protein] reductase [Melioribacteraceae bacterium]|nr:3-oxoacyl-[acyl-carrier-protein] reductase [Melioribacteraceae bacterium]
MILKDKRAIVTGGRRGIGKAIVKELLLNGCNVVFTDIVFQDDNPEAEAKAMLEEFGINDVKLFGFKADASLLVDAQATVDFAIEKLGGLDFLVNNAGITRDNLLIRMSEDEFDKVINANLKSVFNYTKCAVRPMMTQRYGKIVNIASVVGIMGNPGQANYVASKAGVIGMTKSNAKEFSSRNININAVAPGFIETEMTNKLNDKQKEAMLSLVPLKRMGRPEDVARVVKFLLSADSDYLTGQVIPIDGGMIM